MSNARNIASIAGEDVLNASNEIVPVYACRAWVNFNGLNSTATDSTPAITTSASSSPIRASGNITSVLDIGGSDAGVYTINFENNMPHVNYCALATHGDDTNIVQKSVAMVFDYQLGSISVSFEDVDAGGYDVEMVNLAIFC